MGETSISWTDLTWNPTRGCKVVSPGCTNCYAMTLAGRYDKPGLAYEGLTQRTPKGHVTWNGKVMLAEHKLNEPFTWERKAAKTGQPIRVFVDSMSDLFYDAIPEDYVDAVFDVMYRCHHVVFQVLTKRPERMAEYVQRKAREVYPPAVFQSKPAGEWWAMAHPNIWLGTSVEDQTRADERIPHLIQTPAAVRFLSCEPLLGELVLARYLPITHDGRFGWVHHDGTKPTEVSKPGQLHWIIVGGESGPGFRPMDLDWARSLRDQCNTADIAFFFKQSSGRLPGKGTFLDGREWHEFPPPLLRDAVEAK